MLPKNYQETLDTLIKYQAFRPIIGFFRSKYVLALQGKTLDIKDELKKDGFRFGVIPYPENSIESLFSYGNPIWYIEVDEMPNLQKCELQSVIDSSLKDNSFVEILTIDDELLEFQNDLSSKWAIPLLVRIGDTFQIRIVWNDNFKPVVEKYRKNPHSTGLELENVPFYNYIY